MHTYRLEGCDLVLAGRNVVYDKPTMSFTRVLIVEQVPVRNLRHALTCSVTSFEVHICSPVIAQLDSSVISEISEKIANLRQLTSLAYPHVVQSASLETSIDAMVTLKALPPTT